MAKNDAHPITQFFSNHHPLAKYINFEFGKCHGANVEVKSVGAECFLSNPETNELHSAYSTLILDSIMGGAVLGMLEKLVPIATVEFSVNHIRRARLNEKYISIATCTDIHNDLAFVTGSIKNAETGELIANSIGSFMINTRNSSIREKNAK